MSALKCYPSSFASADRCFKKDKQFILDVINDGYPVFKYASKKNRNDKEIVLAAVKQWGLSLRNVSEELRNDKEVVLTAVKQDGRALKYASNELKNDKEVVLAAVKQVGWTLKYASEELKNDEDVVFAAVKQNKYALRYIGSNIDKNVILDSIRRYSRKATDDLLINEESAEDFKDVEELDAMLNFIYDNVLNDINNHEDSESQNLSLVLSDDLNADIEKIDSMIESLTSLKGMLEEKRNAQIKICELDTAINDTLRLYNNSVMAFMSMEDVEKIVSNSSKDKHEKNGKQYTLENL